MSTNFLALLCPDWRGPSLVLDRRDWRVAYANWECLRYLAAEPGVVIKHGHLSFMSPDSSREFALGTEDLARRGYGSFSVVLRSTSDSGMALARLNRPHGLLKEILGTVAPNLNGHVLVVDFHRSGYVPDAPSITQIGRAFGLSPSEITTISDLAAGQSIERIATSRKLSVATVRQRVKSILTKMDCKRQLEVLTIIRNLCPGAAPS